MADQDSVMPGGFEKLSVNVPKEVGRALRKRVGRRGISKFVGLAIQQALENERLSDLIAEFDSRLGPVPDDVLDEVRHAWRKP